MQDFGIVDTTTALRLLASIALQVAKDCEKDDITATIIPTAIRRGNPVPRVVPRVTDADRLAYSHSLPPHVFGLAPAAFRNGASS